MHKKRSELSKLGFYGQESIDLKRYNIKSKLDEEGEKYGIGLRS